jgi:hypothetical protein
MATVVICFVLALASKPMAVTLPFVLLLLDWWPLRRAPEAASLAPFSTRDSVVRLFSEKWLLFVLSVASCVVTVIAQRLGGAVQSLETFPFSARVANALWSYAVYIGKLFVPVNLAVLYPHPGTSLAAWKPLLAIALLLTVTISVWRQRVVRPYLIVGWLWYLGTMFPVIGIVQVGDQAMADRYAYIPFIGLFVMISWGAAELFDHWKLAPFPRRALAATALALMLLITRRELGYWRDSITIWTHSLEVTGDPAMERQLANALIKADRIDEAAPHLLEAIKLDPEDVSSHANLGGYYSSHGHREDAVREFETTVALTERPNLNMQDRLSRMSALLGLGFADVEAGNFSEAQTSFASAIQVDGPQVDALIASLERTVEAQPSDIRYVELSLLLRATGREQDSNAVLENVVKTSPNYSRARQLRDFLRAQATGGTKTRTGQEGGI